MTSSCSDVSQLCECMLNRKCCCKQPCKEAEEQPVAHSGNSICESMHDCMHTTVPTYQPSCIHSQTLTSVASGCTCRGAGLLATALQRSRRPGSHLRHSPQQLFLALIAAALHQSRRRLRVRAGLSALRLLLRLVKQSSSADPGGLQQ